MQGFKQEEMQLGEFTYRVTQLDAVVGYRTFTRLMKVVRPVAEKRDEGFGAFFAEVVKHLDAKEIRFYCALFVARTEVEADGNAVPLANVFGVHFAGRYAELIDWLAFCFKVNFAGFFKPRERAAAGGQANSVRIELEPEVWWTWRLLSSTRIRLTLTELERMSIDDALEAHHVIDALEDAEYRAHQKAEQRAASARS